MARQGHYADHWLDSDGNPAGGVSTGRGFTLSWQNGPLGQLGTPTRREPNGCFVEDVLQAVIGRLEFYQASRFACAENAEALAALGVAAEALERRTRDREARIVEGTYTA
jgi:hypothetical protein